MSEITKKGNMKNTIKCLGARSKQLAAAILLGVGGAVIGPITSNAQVLVNFDGITATGGTFTTDTEGDVLPFIVTIEDWDASSSNPDIARLQLGLSPDPANSLLRMEFLQADVGDFMEFDVYFSSATTFTFIASSGGTPNVNASNINAADTLVFTAIDADGNELTSFAGWDLVSSVNSTTTNSGVTATITGTTDGGGAPFVSFTLAPMQDILGVRVRHTTNTDLTSSGNSTQLQLSVVPEPSSAALMIIAGAGLFMACGRRRLLGKTALM